MFFSTQQVTGDVVNMQKSDMRHIDPAARVKAGTDPEKSFGEVLLNAFGGVNELHNNSAALTQQMITDPDSVDVHDVTIASAEANLALSITKAVVDRALTAYREIMNTR